MNPWEILGLARGCSERDIRQAYARLLKQHRPDKDPEGFRRIHDAYEWLRANAGWFANQTLSETVEPPVIRVSEIPPAMSVSVELPPNAPEPSPAVSPEPVLGAIEPLPAPASVSAVKPRKSALLIKKIARKLTLARKKKSEKLEIRALNVLLKYWRKKKKAGDFWDRYILKQMNRDDAKILPLLTPDDALLDIKREGGQIAHAMLTIFSRRGGWPTVLGILDKLEKELGPNPSPAVVDALILGARQIALLEWQRAQKIANDVYPHLSGYAKNFELAELDRLIQAGKELAMLNAKDKSVLARCVAGVEVEPKLDGITRAIQNVSYFKKAPTAKTFLAERFPAFRQKLRINNNVPESRPVATSQRRSSSGSGSYWPIIMLVVMLTRLAGSCSSMSGSPSRPTYEYKIDQKQQRELEEIMKRLNEQKKLNNGKVNTQDLYEQIKKQRNNMPWERNPNPPKIEPPPNLKELFPQQLPEVPPR